MNARSKIVSSPLPLHSGRLQRKCACGGTPGPTRDCERCRKKRLSLQRRAENDTRFSEAPPIVYDVLRTLGQALDVETRAFFEIRFGHDFSQVRVHTDAKAAQSARAVNALAYTVGKDIVFGRDSFKPATPQGQKLIAHELVHVVQQTGSAPIPEAASHVDPVDSSAEMEAEMVATRVLRQAHPPGNPPVRVGRAATAVNRTPSFMPDCSEYDRCKVVEPLGAANQLLDRVLAALPPLASGAVSSGRIVNLLNVHFHDPDNVAGRAAIVLDNFRSIKTELNASIRFICHPPAQDCATEQGQTGAFTGDQPGDDISLCLAYHRADCPEQARMLIHEICHHIPATRIDHAYVHEAAYMALRPEQATENPDTYAQFSKMVFLGAPSCRDCGSEVQLRPGRY